MLRTIYFFLSGFIRKNLKLIFSSAVTKKASPFTLIGTTFISWILVFPNLYINYLHFETTVLKSNRTANQEVVKALPIFKGDILFKMKNNCCNRMFYFLTIFKVIQQSQSYGHLDLAHYCKHNTHCPSHTVRAS